MRRPQSASPILLGTEPTLQIRDMFDTVERNYEWQHFKLDSPKTYFSYGKRIPKIRPKATHRGHYLNDLYKTSKYVPGVGKYKLEVFPGAVKPAFSKKHATSYRKTYIDDICDKENRAKTPGPGTYFKRKNREEDPKKEDENMGAADRGTYLDEVEYLASATPGIGEYNIATRMLKKSFNSVKPKPQRLTKSAKPKPLKTQPSTTPLLQGTFDFIQRSTTKLNQTFTKQKRFKPEGQRGVPRSRHYQLKRVWSANNTDHFIKQLSTLPSKSIYYD